MIDDKTKLASAHAALQREHERQIELARFNVDKHLQTVAPGDNRKARRAQRAELRALDKAFKRRMKAQGVKFVHD